MVTLIAQRYIVSWGQQNGRFVFFVHVEMLKSKKHKLWIIEGFASRKPVVTDVPWK